MTIGVYSITNKKTGQIYIGQSIHIEKRWQQHIKNGTKYSFVDRAIKKNGKNNFIFKILIDFDKTTPFLKEVLNDTEKSFISIYNTYNNPKHYNLTPGGDGTYIEKHTFESMKEMSKSKTNTGIFRVTKYPRKELQQGFEYRYQYYDKNKKRHALTSKHLNLLEKKVKDKNLPWIVIDKKLFFKTIKMENIKKNTDIDFRNNSTGFFRVYKNKVNDAKQGFRYYYSYLENNKKKGITSIDIKKLEKKVKDKNLPWYIVDEEKANKILKYEEKKNE